MSDQEESKRVSMQLSSLSTQLIESVDKQSRLEEQLRKAKKTIASQSESAASYESLREQLEKAQQELTSRSRESAELERKLAAETTARKTAQDKIDQLNKEVEDLTASLFDEANNMVADARREKHDVEVRNSKLHEQLHEKDALLETLEMQLKNLKKVLYSLEDENSSLAKTKRNSAFLSSDTATSSNVSLEKTATGSTSLGELSGAGGVLFSPVLQSLRYDLGLYNEFLKFVAMLPICRSIKGTTTESKLLRRLVHDEIQPVLRLDNASGLGWLVRRGLMSLMIDGLVVVEPLSGVNETYRMGYSSPQLHAQQNAHFGQERAAHLYNYPTDSPPVAIHEACAFCSESRNDILEHGRLYVLKTLQRNEDGTTETTNQYPLCHYCLLKVRQTCEIFAFLRSLKEGVWHLEKVTLTSIATGGSSKFSEVTKTPHTSATKEEAKSKRMSFMAGLSRPSTTKLMPTVEGAPNFAGQSGQPVTNIQRAWAQLCKLRASLHWAHIGVWSIEDSVALRIGPLMPEEKTEQVEGSIASSMGREEWVPMESPDDESFALQKDEDADSAETFDFEKGDTTGDTTGDTIQAQSDLQGSLHGDLQTKPQEDTSTTHDPAKTDDQTPVQIDDSLEHAPDNSSVQDKKEEESKDTPRLTRKPSAISRKKLQTEKLFEGLDALSEGFKQDMDKGLGLDQPTPAEHTQQEVPTPSPKESEGESNALKESADSDANGEEFDDALTGQE